MLPFKTIRLGRYEDEFQQMKLDLGNPLFGSSISEVPVAVYMMPWNILAMLREHLLEEDYEYIGKKHYAKPLSYYFGNRSGCLGLQTKYREPGKLKSAVAALMRREDLPDMGTVYLMGLDTALFDKVWETAQPEPKKGKPGRASLRDYLGRSPNLHIPTSLGEKYRGKEQQIVTVRHLIMLATQNDHPVLIQGESGTGKDIVALQIHKQGLAKTGGEFYAVNCAAIPEHLLESELFGHVKGAFTGANENKVGLWKLANNGTLFLDEIADLAPHHQAKLLRALEHKSFFPVGGVKEVKSNARIIAASNKNLVQLVKENRFRKDLYYRLFGIPINTPALREHAADIPALAQYFWKEICKASKKDHTCPPDPVFASLEKRRWPGNARELHSLIVNLVALADAHEIDSHLVNVVLKEWYNNGSLG